MGDQSEIRELRRRLEKLEKKYNRLEKLEDVYNKDKKQRKTLIALLRLAFVKLKEAYEAVTDGEDINIKMR